jgi:plastocyanin
MSIQGTVGVAVVFLLVGGLFVCPPNPPHQPTVPVATAVATGAIYVNATSDYGYQPDMLQGVPVAANITVTFNDSDVLQHSFTISSREGFVIPTSYTPSQLNQLFETYPAMYSSLLNGSGEQSVGWFESPATPGWYEFVCTVSGHFQSGMYGFIAFGESLPANLTPPSRLGPGAGDIRAVEAGSVVAALVVVGLGLVVWRRRRTESRMARKAGESPLSEERHRAPPSS